MSRLCKRQTVGGPRAVCANHPGQGGLTKTNRARWRECKASRKLVANAAVLLPGSIKLKKPRGVGSPRGNLTTPYCVGVVARIIAFFMRDVNATPVRKLCAMKSNFEPLYPVCQRRCFRCGQRINGWGFITLYGYITQDGTRRHACGEPLHHNCRSAAARREIIYESDMAGESDYARHVRNVSVGIDYNARTGRYAARADKKRLGTYETPEQAEHARQEYFAAATPHRHYRKKGAKKHEK